MGCVSDPEISVRLSISSLASWRGPAPVVPVTSCNGMRLVMTKVLCVVEFMSLITNSKLELIFYVRSKLTTLQCHILPTKLSCPGDGK